MQKKKRGFEGKRLGWLGFEGKTERRKEKTAREGREKLLEERDMKNGKRQPDLDKCDLNLKIYLIPLIETEHLKIDLGLPYYKSYSFIMTLQINPL